MKSFERRERMKENNKMQASLDLREGGDEWMRKHVLPPKPSQGHQREGDQLCVHMSVCGCVCVRADQQLGVGVSVNDRPLPVNITITLHLDTMQKRRTHVCALGLRFLGTCRQYFPSSLPKTPKSWKKQQLNPEPITHTTNWSLPGMTQLIGFFSLLPTIMTALIWIYASTSCRSAHSECVSTNERCKPTWHQLKTKNTVVIGAGKGQWMLSMWECVWLPRCVWACLWGCVHVTECFKLLLAAREQEI